MPEYIVRWEVEVDADTPDEAADLALLMLPFPGNDSQAAVFDVLDPNDESLILQVYIRKR